MGITTLSDKTNLRLTVATFITVIIFVVTVTASAFAWKVHIEAKVDENSAKIEENAKNCRTLMNAVADQHSTLIEMQTDIKWIRADLEKKANR